MKNNDRLTAYLQRDTVCPPYLDEAKLARLQAERDARRQILLVCAASVLWSMVFALFAGVMITVSRPAGLLVLSMTGISLAGLFAAAVLLYLISQGKLPALTGWGERRG